MKETLGLVFIIGLTWLLSGLVWQYTHQPKQRDLTLIKENAFLYNEAYRMDGLLKEVFQQPVYGKPILSTPVTATGYSARRVECDSTPEVTASMKPSRVGMLAISRDLEDELGLRLGQFVVLKGMGLFQIADRMNDKWRRRVDVLHGNAKAARLFGKKQVELIWVGR